MGLVVCIITIDLRVPRVHTRGESTYNNVAIPCRAPRSPDYRPAGRLEEDVYCVYILLPDLNLRVRRIPATWYTD